MGKESTHGDGQDSEKSPGRKKDQSKAVCEGHPICPLTFTESQMIISAEIQLETLSAYVSSCWRERSVREPSHAGRPLPSAGRDMFLLANHQDGHLLCVRVCIQIYIHIRIFMELYT